MGRPLVLFVLLLVSAVARGEDLTPSPGPVSSPRGRVELLTSLSARSGAFEAPPLPVHYGGFAPGAYRLSAATFPWGDTWGMAADFNLESFRVGGENLSGGTYEQRLLGFQLFPSAIRHWELFSGLPGLGVEAQVGYGFGALPVVATFDGAVRNTVVSYSGPQVGVALLLERPIWSLRLRANTLPFAFTRSSEIDAGRVGSLTLGAQASYGGWTLGSFRTSVLFDYEVTSTQANLDAEGQRTAGLGAHRFGIGLRAVLPGSEASQEQRVSLPPVAEVKPAPAPRKPTGPGTLRGVVRIQLSDDKSAPAPEILVEVPGGPSVRTAMDGSYQLTGVGPGPVAVTIQAKGYKRVEELASVPPEGEAQLDLSLEKAAAEALAWMRGRVRSTRGRQVKAVLLIPEAKIKTATKADGSFNVRLPGGRYTVVFQADGYVSQTRVVDVGSGDQALFYVDLSPKER